MNASTIVRQAACLALIASSTLSQSALAQPNELQVTRDVDPRTGFPANLNPQESWLSLLTTAKAAEEGDADLKSASDQYTTVVRIFEQLRPLAAEALFRYAVVEGRREHTAESQASFARILQWFPDLPEYVAKSREALGDAAPPQVVPGLAGAPGAGMPGPTPSRSAGMSPELRARYGLPEDTGKEPSPSAPATRSSSGLADLTQRRAQMALEMTRTAAEVRRARMESQRLAGFANLPVSKIPPNLVNDPRLRTLLDAVSEPWPTNSDPKSVEQLKAQQIEALERYFTEVYKPRLELTSEVLSREMDILRMEMEHIDEEISRLRLRY